MTSNWPTRNTHNETRSASAAADREHRIGQAEPELPLQVDADADVFGKSVEQVAQLARSHARHDQPAQMRRNAARRVSFTACSSGIPASSVAARSSIDRRSRPRGSSSPSAASPWASGKPARVKDSDLARQLGRPRLRSSDRSHHSVRLSRTSSAPPEAHEPPASRRSFD